MRSRNDNRRSHCSGPPTRRLLTRVATTACTLLSTTLALTTAIAGPSDSEPAPDHEPDRGSSFIAPRSSQLLGDFGGARGRLEDAGVLIQLFYNQTLAWKAPGGGADPAGRFGHSGSYDLFARVDFEELVGWPGLDVLLHVKGQYDRNINAAVGALSNPIDDADFDAPIYIDEFWLEQAFLDDRLRFRLGFLEQQTVFDRNAFANSEDRQFLTTFLDNNAVVPLPNGLGIVALAIPVEWLELALGAADADNVPRVPGFDTAFDGVDSVTGYLELTLRSRFESTSGPLRGAYRMGVFIDGRELPVLGVPDATRRGHVGAYLSFDQEVYRERTPGPQGLGVFARFGYADEDVNRIAWFWSLGAQYLGLFPKREADLLGLGVYQAIGSGREDSLEPALGCETGIEIYYSIRVLPWLALTPDFQYIIDPGADGTADDAFVAALRLRMSF
jgi:porin